jgi:hypothetical protein
MSSPVAVMIRSCHIVCLSCVDDATYDKEHHVAVYPVNLARYDQSCHDCGKALVTGSFGCQLYDANQCSECKADDRGGLRAASEVE